MSSGKRNAFSLQPGKTLSSLQNDVVAGVKDIVLTEHKEDQQKLQTVMTEHKEDQQKLQTAEDKEKLRQHEKLGQALADRKLQRTRDHLA